MSLAPAPVLQRLAPVGGPLAGRAVELGRLREAWRRAVEGSGGTVLVAGEAGVGKTRLAAELAGEVEAAGATVAIGRCPAGGAEPYHALVEALGRWSGDPGPSGPWSGVPGGSVDRDAMFAAAAGTVVDRARLTPMLLVLDDLQRADRSSLMAIRCVVEAAAGSSVLVVGTYRDTGLDRSHPLTDFLAAVLERPSVEQIVLGGLRPEELIEMVGDDELARRLWRHSDGNPVMVGELLRMGTLDGPLPPTFEELVDRRAESLSSPARRLLEAAAVAGSEFRVDVVAAAAELRGDRVPAALKQLVAAGFVVKEPTGPDDTRRFVHDMVRETIARRLDSATSVRLHHRLGRALHRLRPAGGAPAAVLAWHFRAAAPVGGSPLALAQSARAGHRATELLAWEEAAVHYGHALAAAVGARTGVRADLLLSLGEVQRLAGETARARQAFIEAATLARSCADGARLARAALALGQVVAVWGADHELEALAGEARSLLGTASPAFPALALSNTTDFTSGELYDILDDVAPKARPVAAMSHAGRAGATAALLRARHVALAGPERAAERLATAGELLAVAAETGDDELAALARGWRMVDALQLGCLEDAAADQAAHAELVPRLGGSRHARDAASWSAMRAMLDGRVDDARSAAEEAFSHAVDDDDPEADDSFLVQRWWLALEWGTPEDLSEVSEGCRARASTAAGGTTWRAASALALARGGDLELAAEELRRVTDHGLGQLVRDPGRLHPLSCLAEVAWILGDGHRAATVGPLLEFFADRVAVAGRGLACQGSVARACGLVAASAGQWDDAERHFESALAVHRRMGALPLLARTRFEWSRVLVERGRMGDKRRSADFRRKSAELATRLGMSRLLEELAGPAI